jgi:hypothetical protein
MGGSGGRGGREGGGGGRGGRFSMQDVVIIPDGERTTDDRTSFRLLFGCGAHGKQLFVWFGYDGNTADAQLCIRFE